MQDENILVYTQWESVLLLLHRSLEERLYMENIRKVLEKNRAIPKNVEIHKVNTFWWIYKFKIDMEIANSSITAISSI